ncbi:MAG: hypothetical protein IH901_00045 [Proteobacteria bacterium]|nr:hypothetical protein [Pseudomonadota bacterium]
MKKLLYIVAGASLASLIGLSGVVLGGEKDDSKNDDEAQAVDYNSSRSNTSTAVKTGGDEGGDDVQGSGDPLKGLNVTSCKNYPKGKCPTVNKPDDGEGGDDQGITVKVPFKDAEDDYNKKGISTDGDEGDDVQGSGDPLKGLNVAREKKKGVSAPDDGDDDDSRKKNDRGGSL